jgi:hypothetical protein
MAILESSAERLIIQSGSALNRTTLTLDRRERHAHLERSVLMWRRKPVDFDFVDVEEVKVTVVKDAASGTELHTPMVRLRSGRVVPLPAADDEAEATVARVRSFIGH